MKKTVKTVFPFGLLIASTIFFMNPTVQLVDVLPDLFGYILLVAGLGYLADLNESIGEARARFKKMFFVCAAKLIVFVMAFGGLVSPQEQSNFVLVACLSFCVIDLLILVPAVRSLFAGMMQLATKYGSVAIFATKPRELPREPRGGFKNEKQRRAFEMRVKRVEYKNARLRCALEKLQTLTLAFVFAKPIMTLLPEFSALSSTEYNEGLVDFYDFISLFRGFGFILLLPLSIVWAMRVFRFLGNLRRDVDFCSLCLVHYQVEVQPRTDLFTRRAVYAALSVFGIAMIFSLDFYLEYYNVIPDTLCAIFMIAGALLIRKYITNWKPVVLSAVGYGVMTLVSSALTVYFNQVHYFNAIYWDAAAYLVFTAERAATVLENAMFVLMLWMTIRAMTQMITRYSGFSVTSAQDPQSNERVQRVHAVLKKSLYVFFFGGVAAAISGVAYEFFKPTVPFIWMIDFAVSAVCIYLFYRATWEIREQVEYKYMLS